MENESEKDTIDVDFEEDTSTRFINGKPIYYRTSDISTILSENDSTIRYWCDMFQDFIKVKRSGRNRRFTDGNIEQLKFIQKLLREDNLTIEQAIEFVSLKEADKLQHKVENGEPLPITVLSSMLGKQLSEQLEEMKFQMVEELIQKMNTNFQYQNEIHAQENMDLKQEREELKEFIAVTLNEQNTKLDKLSSFLDTKEQEAKNRDIELLDTLRKGMEDRKKENELQQQSRGFFGRLFGK